MGRGFPGGPVNKETTCNTGDSGLILGQEDLLEKEMATFSQYSCLGKSHGQRSLADLYIFHKKYVFHSYFVYLMSSVLINFYITMELHNYKSLYEVERNIVA